MSKEEEKQVELIVEERTPVRPGWQTTEFWQAILTTAAGLGLLVYGIVSDRDVAIQWGAALAGISAGAYTVGRSILKR